MNFYKKVLPLIAVIVIVATILVGCAPTNFIEEATNKGDNYTITAGYDATNHILTCLQDIAMTNRMDNALTTIDLHLYANAYSNKAHGNVVANNQLDVAYPNGINYGNVTITDVMVNGEKCSYTLNDSCDLLTVTLKEELFPDEKLVLSLDYTVQLANIHHRLGYGENTVNLGSFYPILCHNDGTNYIKSSYTSIGDPFVSEMANYAVTLTLPNNYKVASSGELLSAQANGDNITYKYQANAVRDFAMVLSDKYNVKTHVLGDTTINYCYYNDGQPDVTLATIIATMKYMNDNVGAYPYSQITVAESDFCYGGMEYPNMVMVSSGLTEYTTAVVHELIHQWFYGVVGSDQINYPWMDEALTEYLTMVVLDNMQTKTLGSNVAQYFKAYTTYVDVLSTFYGTVDTSMRATTSYVSEQDYVYTTYVKGAIMFYNAYDTMGKDKFNKAVKLYYNNCKGTIAEPQQLIDAFTKGFGADMNGYFNGYLSGDELLYNNNNETTTTAPAPSVMG